MTDEQKDAIVKAAKACVEGYSGERQSARGAVGLFDELVSAVRAAEQPRWHAGVPSLPETGLWLRTPYSHSAVGHVADWELADRIARLLNEDDANGEK
jgi:hypothetical protein